MEMYLYCEGNADFAVICSLLKKANGNQGLSVNRVKRDEIKKWTIHKKPNFKISRAYKMVTILATIALKNGNKNIAYHQDADGEYDVRYERITSEFKGPQGAGINCLAIVPKEMIESWVLADKNAYPQEPKNPQLPTRPEELWGKKNSDKHPKIYLKKVLEQFHQTPSAEIFSELIEKSTLEIIKERCPKSFGQFYNDVQVFIAKAGS